MLFDRFPDGSEVLGGAPFNVAWHLQGFAHAPLFISRVGDDAAGHRVARAMQGWGVDTTALQTDTQYPTGTVEINYEGAQHSFNILPEQACDYIDAEPAQKAIGTIEPALIYHGTLATRTRAASRVLAQLVTTTEIPVFARY